MNRHDEPSPDREELRDRLIDAALRERLGGETPPDLSAAILARASADPAIRSSVTKEPTMTIDSSRQRRRGWKTAAVAATVLIAAGFLISAAQVNALRVARRSTHSANKAEPRPAATPGDQAVPQGKESDSLMMTVTPHIIIQEEEEDRLGIDVSEELAASPLAPSAEDGEAKTFLENLSSMENAINPAEKEQRFLDTRSTAAAPAPTSSEVRNYGLDKPFRQGSFSAEVPQNSGAGGGMAGGMRGGGTPASSSATAPAQRSWDSMYQIELGRLPVESEASEQGQGDSSSLRLPHSTHNDNDARRLAMLKQRLHEVETGIQSKLSASRNSNSQEIRDFKAKAQAITNQIRHLEGKASMGMGANRDQYARITENPFLPVSAANTDHRLSTFSIDVDTASYANVRQFLTQSGMLPPPDAVRIEELVNYFDYAYTPPTGDVPFAAHVEVAGCPWAPEHRLVRVGIKGREIERTQRPLSNLVFLIDVSGSMNEPNKLPLLVEGMKRLTRELGENDRVAIVVYASSEGLALESTSGTDQSKIIAALDQLQAGGSTAGGAGIQLAYQVAQQNFIKGAVNRVILCTDGDFNVGVTSPADLERMAETNAKETGVFLTVLGFGRGNLNDAMMEQIADKGNGNYHYIDTRREAGKVLVEEMSGTLVTIAKDVKIQIEFNPAQVAGYRLIGYENRVMAAEDFNNDKKDAGEIGAGHTVTALYEIIPAGQEVPSTPVDQLKYAPGAEPLQRSAAPDDEAPSDAEASDELLTLKIRYKAPDGDKSDKLEFPIIDNGNGFAHASDDFKFASAVASFGMLLRNSEHKGNATYAGVIETAAASKDHDPHGYRQEFVEVAKRAKELAGE